MHAVIQKRGDQLAVRHAGVANSGPKGPPSAPPTIPPIIINPFNQETPPPAVDPRPIPVGPPLRPPRGPDWRCPRYA
ncbi:hypothetical protein [Massilia sp. MS-15]|uniref:hypothetical protein n=1 Tax=Massilia sp. MS-15 TaxID=2878200 RepID=UPI001CD1BA02|nr:hypothetical protein [Massilia sp. MS-15]MCA1247530.1 hypothetical protein [Massilia sp. MS-15]